MGSPRLALYLGATQGVLAYPRNITARGAPLLASARRKGRGTSCSPNVLGAHPPPALATPCHTPHIVWCQSLVAPFEPHPQRLLPKRHRPSRFSLERDNSANQRPSSSRLEWDDGVPRLPLYWEAGRGNWETAIPNVLGAQPTPSTGNALPHPTQRVVSVSCCPHLSRIPNGSFLNSKTIAPEGKYSSPHL